MEGKEKLSAESMDSILLSSITCALTEDLILDKSPPSSTLRVMSGTSSHLLLLSLFQRSHLVTWMTLIGFTSPPSVLRKRVAQQCQQTVDSRPEDHRIPRTPNLESYCDY